MSIDIRESLAEKVRATQLKNLCNWVEYLNRNTRPRRWMKLERKEPVNIDALRMAWGRIE